MRDENDSTQRMAVGGAIAGFGLGAAFLLPLHMGAAPFTGAGLAIGAQAMALGVAMVASGLLKRRRFARLEREGISGSPDYSRTS